MVTFSSVLFLRIVCLFTYVLPYYMVNNMSHNSVTHLRSVALNWCYKVNGLP